MNHRETGRLLRISGVLAVAALPALATVSWAGALRLADTTTVEYRARSGDEFSFTLELPAGWKAPDIAKVRGSGVGIMSRPNLEGPGGSKGVINAVFKANDAATVKEIRTSFDDILRTSEEHWLERTKVISFGDWTALLSARPFHSQLQKSATYVMYVMITTRQRDRLVGMTFYFSSPPTIDTLAEVEMITRSLKESSK